MKITTIGELEYACHENRLLKLEGFGQKTQDILLEGIEHLKKHRGTYLYNAAQAQAEIILRELKKSKDIIRINIAGSLRRCKETIHDIDILASTAQSDPIMKLFTSMFDIEEIIAQGETKSSVRMTSGINVDLRTVSDRQFPYALLHSTGSKEHNTALRSRAKGMGLKMNEYGLFKNGKANIPCKDEAEIYKKLGLAYIPPELREDMGEIQAAAEDRLPKLVQEKQLQGFLHVHTDWSDGVNTIEEMAQAAQTAGYRWMGVADHSQSAVYAHGIRSGDVAKYVEEIDQLNAKIKNFHVFKGAEVDILDDGSLDYNPEILRIFDYIVIAVHSRFNMSEDEMTRRIIRAMENDCFTILAHPTGRLLLARDAYSVNIRSVIEAAQHTGTVIELNANPHRLDLDWRQCKYARELGVKLCINPDAHRTEGIAHIQYGLGIARKGWLEATDLLNCLTVEEMQHFMHAGKLPG